MSGLAETRRAALRGVGPALVLRGAVCALAAALAAPAALAEPYYLIVTGLGGEPSYAAEFAQQADALATAARRTVGDESRVVVMTGKAVSRESLEKAFKTMAQKVNKADSVIVFLLGHGSYDGQHYKFNIPGPDVDGEEIGKWLAAVPARAQLIMDATSASGAVLDQWAAEGRTVITATRSGAERNATRFGQQWAEALSSAEADTNKDEVITTQEAFDFAARKVKDSYESEGTLATEHPQLKGDGAAHLTVARLTERKKRTPAVEALYSRLGDLEGQIEQLRQRRDQLDNETYLNQLQPLLVELATVQQQIDAAEGRGGSDESEGAAAKPETANPAGGAADQTEAGDRPNAAATQRRLEPAPESAPTGPQTPPNVIIEQRQIPPQEQVSPRNGEPPGR